MNLGGLGADRASGRQPSLTPCKSHPEISPPSPSRRRPPALRPRLIYDGDCGFCAYWALYWRGLTGERVEYRPYQQVLAQYPAIPEAEFQRAVQFIAPDGRRASGAEASFLTLARAPGRGFWLVLYRHLPGFAPVSERAYAFIARRRPTFFRAEPPPVGPAPRAAALTS